MKRNNIGLWIFIIILILAVIGIVIFLGNDKTEMIQNVEKLDIVHGEKFTYIEEYKDKYIIDYQLQDITNDNIKDDLILLGDKENVNDVYAKNICLVIRDGNSGKYYDSNLKNMDGYETNIQVKELTNDNVMELMITSNVGGGINNKLYTILRYENEKISEIFNTKNCNGLNVKGEFLDNYSAKIKIEKVKNDINIDLTDQKEYYSKKRIYDENNKLINKDVKITTYPINNLEKIELEGKQIGIKTYQNIMGVDKTDILDVIECTLKFEKNKFEVVQIESQKIGKLL